MLLLILRLLFIILANVAGIGHVGSLVATTAADVDKLYAVNVRGVFNCCKSFAISMLERKSGSIINMASIGAYAGGYGSVSYGAVKAALLHLTRCAAVELGEDNVRVNSISPGAIATAIFGKAFGLDSSAAEASAERLDGVFKSFQPIPRAGLPQDVAAAAVFLASDEASFINGEDIVVDGGRIRGRRPGEVKAHGAELRKAIGDNEN